MNQSFIYTCQPQAQHALVPQRNAYNGWHIQQAAQPAAVDNIYPGLLQHVQVTRQKTILLKVQLSK